MSTQARMEQLARRADELEREAREFTEAGLRWLGGVSLRSAKRARTEMTRLAASLS